MSYVMHHLWWYLNERWRCQHSPIWEFQWSLYHFNISGGQLSHLCASTWVAWLIFLRLLRGSNGMVMYSESQRTVPCVSQSLCNAKYNVVIDCSISTLYIYIHIYIHTPYIYVYIFTYIHHIYIHTPYVYIYIHTRIYIYIHTYTHHLYKWYYMHPCPPCDECPLEISILQAAILRCFSWRTASLGGNPLQRLSQWFGTSAAYNCIR